MKFDRQLRPATETSWVVSYDGKTIPRWRTAAILKIDKSPYLCEKSADFDEILYTAADFELGERHVIKNEKVALDKLHVRQNVFLVQCTITKTQQQTIALVGTSSSAVAKRPRDASCLRCLRKLVHWPLTGGLLHLVQRGEAWAGSGFAQSPHASLYQM